MRVVFLGAGASLDADYPSGRDLLDRVERHLEGSVEASAKAYWEWFVNARALARESGAAEARLIWDSSNPEVVVSYLDLCIEAVAADDADIDHYVHEVLAETAPAPHHPMRREAIEAASQTVQNRYDSPARETLQRAIRARTGLLVAVNTLFRDLHFRDSRTQPSGPAYLKERLSNLQVGDVVITTNYDCLVERVLLAETKWSPADGYGFSIPLSSAHSADVPFLRRPPIPLPDAVQQHSRVLVLKLHGSVGWTATPRTYGRRVLGDQYYEGPRLHVSQDFFRGLVSEQGPLTAALYDSREPPHGDPGDPALVLPTFMKRSEGHEFHATWLRAGQALAEANIVEIIGASLPESDIGVRVLMNPLRARLDAGVTSATVLDPSPETYHRWKMLLGPKIKWEKSRIGTQGHERSQRPEDS